MFGLRVRFALILLGLLVVWLSDVIHTYIHVRGLCRVPIFLSCVSVSAVVFVACLYKVRRRLHVMPNNLIR